MGQLSRAYDNCKRRTSVRNQRFVNDVNGSFDQFGRMLHPAQSDLKYLLHFVAEVVDDLHANLAAFGFREWF